MDQAIKTAEWRESQAWGWLMLVEGIAKENPRSHTHKRLVENARASWYAFNEALSDLRAIAGDK